MSRKTKSIQPIPATIDSLTIIPRVGIVIPCHNHGVYLPQAIQSVLQQDYQNLSIAIIDDGSTDESYDVARNLLSDISGEEIIDDITITTGKIQNYPSFLIHVDKPQKQAAARNHGIKKLWPLVKYFCPLDADDILLPTKISKSVAILESDQEFIGLVYSDSIIYNTITQTRIHEFKQPYSRVALENQTLHISNNSVISKKALSIVGYYDEELPPCEDLDLWLRITEQFIAIHIPEPLCEYRVTEQSCATTIPVDYWQAQYDKIFRKMQERRKGGSH